MKTVVKKITFLLRVSVLLISFQLSAQTSCFNPITCSSYPCEKISNGSINNFGFNVSSDYTPLNNYCAGSGSYVYCWHSSHGAACVTSISNVTPFTCPGWLGDLAMKAMGTPPAQGDGIFQDQTISLDKLYFLSYKYKVTNLTSPYYTLYGPQVVPSFGTLSEFNVKFILKSTASSLCSSGALYDPIPTVTTQQTIDQITNIAPMGSYVTKTACIKANNNYDAIWLYPRQNAGTTNSRISVDDISLIEVGAGSDQTVSCVSSATLGEGCSTIPGAIYSWAPTTGLSNPNILNPTVSFGGTNGTVIYTLTVTYNGCSLSDEVTVTSDAGVGLWDYTSSNAANGTQGFDIARDSDGNIYVCGTFENSATFPASTPVNILGAGLTPRSAYLAKFNNCGALQWINYEDASGWSEGRSLVIDPTGNSIFMSGASTGDLRFQTTAASPGISAIPSVPFSTTCYYLARFHKVTGAYIDAYAPALTTGYSNYEINSIALHKISILGVTIFKVFTTGSAYKAANTSRVVLINNINLSSSTGYSNAWTQFAHNPSAISQAWDIIYNPISSNLYITGDFQKTMNLLTSSTTFATVSSGVGVAKEGFICTIDQVTGYAATTLFRKTGVVSGETASGRALTVDAAGDVYYTGYYTGSLTSLYGFPTSLSGAPGRQAMYVLRTNGTSMVWRNRILPISTGNCVGMGIAINTSSVYVSGSFENGNLFFPGGGGTYTSPGKRMFIATFNRASSALVSGNTSNSSNPSSNHLTEKVTCDDSFAYTCGTYEGEFDYSVGSPSSGILISTPLLTNQNLFVVRNGAGVTNPFRLINNESAEKGIAIENNINLYPNPTNGMVSIKMQEELIGSNVIIEVTDINGRLLYSENKTYTNETSIDINKFEAGLYIINIKSENINHHQKIIKQ